VFALPPEQLLEEPTRGSEYADEAAEWHANHEVVDERVAIVNGLTNPSRKRRVPLTDALSALESLCERTSVRSGVAVSGVSRECAVCMAAPRSVRFGCGHCLCCEPCTRDLLQRGAPCPSCRSRIRVVERGEELNEAQTFLARQAGETSPEASWLAKMEEADEKV
jgi:hypothetical protein